MTALRTRTTRSRRSRERVTSRTLSGPAATRYAVLRREMQELDALARTLPLGSSTRVYLEAEYRSRQTQASLAYIEATEGSERALEVRVASALARLH